MQFKFQTVLFNKVFRGYFQTKKYNGKVSGISSMCQDGAYVLMCDFDDFPLDLLVLEMKAMQKSYNLGHIWILESSPGKYHAISFSKVSFNELRDILCQIHCDEAYTNAKTIVLRLSAKGKFGKPKLIKVLRGTSDRPNSSAHLLAYIKEGILTASEVKVFYLTGENVWDKNTELIKVSYLS